jgi:outer membrane protein OmpA-like peptidoglycan-associated protein
LADHAILIVADAATASTKLAATCHADTSGVPKRNHALSIRGAEAVPDELVKGGVPKAAIVIQAPAELTRRSPSAPAWANRKTVASRSSFR